MVAAEGAFPHDGYGGLRNYGAPEPVTSSPYPPPGKHLLRLVNLLFLYLNNWFLKSTSFLYNLYLFS